MATKATTTTVAQALARAVAIGAELQRIDQDPGLHRLSAAAWRRLSLELGGFKDAGKLEAVRCRLAGLPYLQREVVTRGELFMRNGQDRPAPWSGFAHGHGDMAAAYSERIMAGLTVEQCSAVACWHVLELAPAEHWGRLGDFAELEAMTGPLHAELVALDRQLFADVGLGDLAWRGSRPCVAHEGYVVVVVDEGSASRLASAVAEAVGQGLALAA